MRGFGANGAAPVIRSVGHLARTLQQRIGAPGAPGAPGARPTLIALDGPGASGKTTLAGWLGRRLDATVIHTDDFYVERSGRDRRLLRPEMGLAQYYDLARLREEALEPLMAGRRARYCRYNWNDEVIDSAAVDVDPSPIILLEGVCSSDPGIGGQAINVYVETSAERRLSRLRARIPADQWDANWLAAEQVYFGSADTRTRFDLVVPGEDSEADADPVQVAAP